MTVGRADSARSVAGAVVVGLLMFVVLVLYAPDSVAFSPNNYGWNGIEGISSAYRVSFASSLSSVPPGAVLVIMQPSINFSKADVEAVGAILAGGGTVVVADKSGVANSLLTGLGSGITIESGYSIDDPLFNWRTSTLPTALLTPGAASLFPFASGVSGIALNQPSPLLLRGENDSSVAVTSQFSYDVARPNSSQVAKGPFVVAAAERMGKGTLLVVSDSQFLLNSEWTIADNRALIGNLFAGSSVYIDASHWTASPLASSTAQLKGGFRAAYAAVAAGPDRYLFAGASVVVALALVPTRGRPLFHNRFLEDGDGES